MNDTRLSRQPGVFRETVRGFARETLAPAADRTGEKTRLERGGR